MKYKIDHDLHIHSKLSYCSSDNLQTTEAMLEYAKANGLKQICVTDHLWDSAVDGVGDWYASQDIAHVSKNLPLPQAEGIEFLFGCETELDKDFRLALAKESFDKFDFIIIPTTHLHMSGMTRPRGIGNEELARLYVKRLAAVLSMDLPFYKVGIAHLACSLMAKGRQPQDVLSLIPDSELMPLFCKAARLGVGIEINAADFNFSCHSEQRIQATLHLFKMAKASGCKFYLGSDAHHPKDFQYSVDIFRQAIDVLELFENDKFIVSGISEF